MKNRYKCHGIYFKRINHPKYKYELLKDYKIKVDVKIHINTDFLTVDNKGNMTIKKGYRWDGCSGPSWDGFVFGVLVNKTNMRAGLVHDALYQLMRMERIPLSYRKYADDLFHKILLQDDMTRWRAWCYWKAVRVSCEKYAKPEKA